MCLYIQVQLRLLTYIVDEGMSDIFPSSGVSTGGDLVVITFATSDGN